VRVCGIVFVSLALFCLVLSSVAFCSANGADEIIGLLLCVGLIQVPMLAIGVLLTRRCEDRTDSVGRADRLSDVSGVASLKRLSQPSSIQHTLRSLRSLDLNQLTFTGWMLFIATLNLAVGLCFAVVSLAQILCCQPLLLAHVFALPIILLSTAFFFAATQSLRLLGLPVYRSQTSETKHKEEK
jgi:hypothetical protein